jgi:hypothetical protein
MLETKGLVLGVASKAVKPLEHVLEPHLLSPSLGDIITTRSSGNAGLCPKYPTLKTYFTRPLLWHLTKLI